MSMTEQSFCVIYLNFLKTFDRVDWDFIYASLQKFGYESKFVQMIDVPYRNIQSKIKIDGLLFHPFTLMWRYCQGHPL